MSSRLTLSHSIGETSVHIIEPVSSQIVHAILERIGFLDVFKDEVYVGHDFRSSNKSVDEDNNPKIQRNRVQAKISPIVNPNINKWEGSGTTHDLANGNQIITNRNTSNIHRFHDRGNNPLSNYCISVFCDPMSYTDITEMIVGTTVNIEMRMEFTDLIQGQEALERVFQTYQNGELISYGDIQYDYPVPRAIQSVLKEIYRLRGSKGNDDSTFYKWLNSTSHGAITVLKNRQDLNKQELVINKNNFQCLYQIECSQEFPEHVAPSGCAITLNIACQFARVNRLVLQYPIIVNNQYLDFDYVATDPAFRTGLPSPIMWKNAAVTDLWWSRYKDRGIEAVKYPWWDHWVVPYRSPFTSYGFEPIVTLAFTLDQLEPNSEANETVIDLSALPGMKLDESLLTEIKLLGNQVLNNTNLVGVAVFADDIQVADVSRLGDHDKRILEITDGTLLHIKYSRPYTVMRLVIGVNRKPVNRTSRPLNYSIYPELKEHPQVPHYDTTQDIVVNPDETYYKLDDTGKFTPIAVPESTEYESVTEDSLSEGVDYFYEDSEGTTHELPVPFTTYTEVSEGDQVNCILDYYYKPDPEVDDFEKVDPNDLSFDTTVEELQEKYGQIYTREMLTSAKKISEVLGLTSDIKTKTPVTINDLRKQEGSDLIFTQTPRTSLTGPVDSLTSQSEEYKRSYRGRQVGNVQVVTIWTSKYGRK